MSNIKKKLTDEQIEQILIEMITPTLMNANIQLKGSSFVKRFKTAKEKLYINEKFEQNEVIRCWDKFWFYITNGILAPGTDLNNLDLPFLHLTDVGHKILVEGVNPYSRDVYFMNIENKAKPLMDDISEMYLLESLNSFYNHCYLGAMVLLGGFSERIFLKFLDRFILNIQNISKKTKFENIIENRFIAIKITEFLAFIEPHKKTLPKELKHQVDLWLNSFLNYIRNVRNKVGHPTGRKVSREELLAMYLTFPKYLENIMTLLGYFINNPIT